MDLLAAISTVDPPSLVAWLVLAFAFALYPLGLMMGTGCSDCCSCGELPYHRCRRTECLTCTPRNGSSASVARIEGTTGGFGVGTGAKLICARSRIFLSVRGSSFTHLAAGNSEQHSATLTRAYNEPTMFLVDGPGPAIPGAFTVIAQGMDLPFSVAKTDTQVFYLSQDVGGTQTKTVAFGESVTARKSVAAALSSHVRAVRVTVGGDYLDGTIATESAMLAMLSLTSPQHGGGERFIFDLTLTPNATLFPYLRKFYSVTLEYTIELRRGSASVYRTLTAVIRNQTYEELPLPEEGLPALSLPAPTFADTPYPCQKQPVIDGTTITVFAGSEVNAQTPEYFSEPYGAGHFFPLSFYSATEALSRSVNCETSRYVFDPTGAASGFNPPAGPYNLNYDEVDEFIRGERCLQWSSGGNTYERCMEPANALCGKGVCDLSWLMPQTATLVTPAPPGCAGTVSVVQRLNSFCNFVGSKGWCNFFVQPSFLNVASLTSFYDGDLLYSLENGPSRPSYTPSAGRTVTLGGTLPGGSHETAWRCPDLSFAPYPGKCFPASVDMTVSASLGALVSYTGPSTEALEEMQQIVEEMLQSLSGGPAALVGISPTCTSASYLRGVLGSAGGRLDGGISIDACGGMTVSGSGSSRRNGNLQTNGFPFLAGVDYGLGGFYFARASYTAGANTWQALWHASGSVSVSATLTDAVLSGGTSAVSPSEMDWRGGEFDISFPSSATVLRGILPARTDAVQQSAAVIVRGASFAGQNLIGTITQSARPCGVVSLGIPQWQNSTGFFSNVSNRTESGTFELGFIDSTPCETPVSVTTTSDWLTIEMDTEGRSFCVRVASNETGEQRQATISISPAWVVPSSTVNFPINAPSSSTTSVLGTLQYALTQDG